MAKKKLPGIKRTVAQLKASAPPATVATRSKGNKGEGTGLMIMVPQETLKSLRAKAAAELITTRALVLRALHDAGYDVPARDLIDRRRKA